MSRRSNLMPWEEEGLAARALTRQASTGSVSKPAKPTARAGTRTALTPTSPTSPTSPSPLPRQVSTLRATKTPSSLRRPTKSSTLRATPTPSATSTIRSGKPCKTSTAKASTLQLRRPLGQHDLNRDMRSPKKRVPLSTRTFTPPTTPENTPTGSSLPPLLPEPAPASQDHTRDELVAAHARIAALEAEVAQLKGELQRAESRRVYVYAEVSELDAGKPEGSKAGVNEASEEVWGYEGLRPGSKDFQRKAAGLQADIDGCWDVLAMPSSSESACSTSLSFSGSSPSLPKPRGISSQEQGMELQAALADAHFKNRALANCLEHTIERAQRAKAEAEKRIEAEVERMRAEQEALVGAWARSVPAMRE